MSEIDMSRTIVPKSDQMNSDDLISGPISIKINKVSANPSSAEQPISIFYEGDQGKPYKPCKSMRRVLVAAWGNDGAEYPGRVLTLYRDPAVTWGGLAVGGIRISHMSHIEAPITMALTATKQSRKPYTVKPYVAPTVTPPTPEAYISRATNAIGRATDADSLTAWWKSEKETALRGSAGLSTEQTTELAQAVTARTTELKNANSGE